MPRDLDGTLAAELTAAVIYPIRLAQIKFKSQTQYLWSGPGPLAWNGVTWSGLGKMGQVGAVTEASEVMAAGTTVMLSGIDPTLLTESLTDIAVGAPARLFRGLYDLAAAAPVGEPYQYFRGYVDKCKVDLSGETAMITLSLESRMTQLGRASFRRYTAQDQHLQFANDSGMDWMEQVQDIALRTGT